MTILTKKTTLLPLYYSVVGAHAEESFLEILWTSVSSSFIKDEVKNLFEHIIYKWMHFSKYDQVCRLEHIEANNLAWQLTFL